MSKAKNQHWLPQLYLRAFCTPDSADSFPRLWTFYRTGPEEPCLRSVEEIATKRYLYSPGENQTNRDHSVDVRLQNLEALLGPIWPSLTKGFLPLENIAIRKALSLFIATLYNRHPHRIKDIQTFHAQFVEALNQLPKDEDGNPNVTHMELKGKRIEIDRSSWAAYKNADKLSLQKSFTGSIIANSGGIAELLLLKRWAIVVADEPVFATCDNPLVLANDKRARFGFRTPGTRIHLPLSPTRFLIIEDPGLPDGYYASQPGFPEAMNYQTWCAADRYLLSSIPSDNVLTGIRSFVDMHGLS